MDGYTQGHHVHRSASTRRTAAATPPSTSAIAISTRSRRTERDFSACALASPTGDPAPDVRLRRLGHDLAGAIPDVNRADPVDSAPTSASFIARTRTARCATSRVDRPVQLRADELLPAAGRAQDRRPVRALRLQRQGERLHRVHVHGRRTIAQIAPSGAFLGGGPGAAAVLRPLSRSTATIRSSRRQQVDSVLRRQRRCGRRADRHRPAQRRRRRPHDDLRAHLVSRGVVGLRGDIADGWSYDVYGLYGTSSPARELSRTTSRAARGGAKALNAVG